jgi:hypothetical protein
MKTCLKSGGVIIPKRNYLPGSRGQIPLCDCGVGKIFEGGFKKSWGCHPLKGNNMSLGFRDSSKRYKDLSYIDVVKNNDGINSKANACDECNKFLCEISTANYKAICEADKCVCISCHRKKNSKCN